MPTAKSGPESCIESMCETHFLLHESAGPFYPMGSVEFTSTRFRNKWVKIHLAT